jgi:hypothetical protein
MLKTYTAVIWYKPEPVQSNSRYLNLIPLNPFNCFISMSRSPKWLSWFITWRWSCIVRRKRESLNTCIFLIKLTTEQFHMYVYVNEAKFGMFKRKYLESCPTVTCLNGFQTLFNLRSLHHHHHHFIVKFHRSDQGYKVCLTDIEPVIYECYTENIQ